MKPFFLLSSADVAFATSHADSSHSMASASYPCADPYLHGMLGPYGPQAIIQPQLARMTAMRVPLPFSMADEGPIYVNVKQYHGILRRRQSRAKQEAQNKLVKARKPYLHESRHRHALNRVRGTGGRFLSTKKLQQSNPGPTTNKDSVSETINVHQMNRSFECESSCLRTGQSGASNTSRSDLIGVSNSDVMSRPPDSLFSGISVPNSRRM
uniref:Nuclear transcription factor Y subunit n=1 Tax=Rhizophora mucronata TaxID=61149 RepID=A0A2P2JG56_RHIMU